MKNKINTPVTILLSLLSITVVVSIILFRNIEVQSRLRFDTQSAVLKNVIENKVNLYENQLNNIQAFFSSSQFVSRKEFEDFINKTGIFKKYPGVSAINYSLKVLDSEKDAYVNSVKNDTSINPKGYPDFKLTPVNEKKDFYYFETYSEPLDAKDTSFGFDLTSVPERATAITNAVNNNSVSNTGKTSIIGTNDIGFILYMPIYKNGLPIETIDQRQVAAQGVLHARFVSNILFDPITNESVGNNGFNYYIFAGDVSQDNLIYSSAKDNSYNVGKSAETSDLILNIGDKEWHLYSYANSGFGLSTRDNIAPIFLVIVGGVVSILVYFLLNLYEKSSIRANEIADRITKELRDSESKYRLIFESFQDVYYKTDFEGNIIMVSPSVEKYLNIKPEEVVKKKATDFYAKPEEREAFLAELKRNGFVNDREIEFKRMDGSIIYVSISAHLVFDENKNPIGSEGIIRDVSERKKIEGDLKSRTTELERLNKLMTGRELKMIDLKNRLKKYEKVEDENI